MKTKLTVILAFLSLFPLPLLAQSPIATSEWYMRDGRVVGKVSFDDVVAGTATEMPVILVLSRDSTGDAGQTATAIDFGDFSADGDTKILDIDDVTSTSGDAYYIYGGGSEGRVRLNVGSDGEFLTYTSGSARVLDVVENVELVLDSDDDAVTASLQIKDGTGSAIFTILEGGTGSITGTNPVLGILCTPGNVSQLNLGDTADNDEGRIVYNPTTNKMMFYVGDALAFTIPDDIATGTVSGTGTDNQVARWDGTDDIQGSSFLITDTGVLVAPDGNAGLPTYTFNTDTDSGLYLDTTNSLGVTLGGSNAATLSAGKFTLDPDSVGLVPSAFSDVDVMGSAASLGIVSSTNTSPSIRMGDDVEPDRVIFSYSPPTDVISLSADGTNVALSRVPPSAPLVALLQPTVIDPTVSSPSFTSVPTLGIRDSGAEVTLMSDATGQSLINFGDTVDDDEGRIIYDPSTDQMFFYTDNTLEFTIPDDVGGGISGTGTDNAVSRWNGTSDIQGSNVTIDDTGHIYGINGTALLPSVSFTSDPDTGITRLAANELSLATGGAVRSTQSDTQFEINPTGSATAPDANSELVVTGTDAGIHLASSGDGVSSIFFGDGADVDSGRILYEPLVSTLSLYANNTEVISVNDTDASVAVDVLPSTDDTYDLGSNLMRWQDIYLGPSTVHIGTSTADEGQLAYNTTTNVLDIGTNSDTSILSVSGSAVDIDNLTLDGSAASVSTIRTVLRATPTADDTSLATEKAVRDAIDSVGGGGGISGTGTDNHVVRWDGTADVQDSSLVISDAGALTAEYGSSTLPAYSFAGDTNTGLYHDVAADTVSMATGTTARMTWDLNSIDFIEPLFGVDGGVSTPTYSFTSDTNTGAYSSGADQYSIAAAGNEMTRVTSSQLLLDSVPGGGTAPSLSWITDPDTGIHNNTTNSLEIRSGGVQTLTSTPAAVSTLVPIAASVGTATAPSYAFTGDTNTGFYWVGADTIGLTTGTTQRMSWDTDSIDFIEPLFGGNGSRSLPTYSFTSDTNTGMYLYGADRLGFAIGSNDALSFTEDQILIEPGGVAANPSYSFENYEDMGMYRIGTSILGFSTSGVERLSVGYNNTTLPIEASLAMSIDPEGTGFSYTPGYNLGVQATSPLLSMISDTGENARMYFGDDVDDDSGRIIYSNTGNSFEWYTNNANRMSLDSGGLIVDPGTLGYSTTGAELGVIGTVAEVSLISNGSFGSTIFFGTNTVANEGSITYSPGTDDLFRFNTEGSNVRMELGLAEGLVLSSGIDLFADGRVTFDTNATTVSAASDTVPTDKGTVTLIDINAGTPVITMEPPDDAYGQDIVIIVESGTFSMLDDHAFTGGNARLSGDWNPDANDSIHLRSNSGDWIEISRSSN